MLNLKYVKMENKHFIENKEILKRYSECNFDLEKYYSRIKLYSDSDDNCSIISAIYLLSQHTKESVKEYNDFMFEYKSNHKYCPNCGSESYSTTLAGFPLYSDRKNEYIDKNHCVCSDCCLKHITHDRIKDKTI